MDMNGTKKRLKYKIKHNYLHYGKLPGLMRCMPSLLSVSSSSYCGSMQIKEKQVEEKMAHQEQMRKEEIYKAKIDFFTNIAHEIRTPITLIKAPLDYILSSQPNEQEIKENLTTMERNTDRLLVLVNQLLDFRKIESKAFTLSLKMKNINAIVINTYNRFMPIARQKHLDMTLECPEQTIIAFVDEEAITKVCSNLLITPSSILLLISKSYSRLMKKHIVLG